MALEKSSNGDTNDDDEDTPLREQSVLFVSQRFSFLWYECDGEVTVHVVRVTPRNKIIYPRVLGNERCADEIIGLVLVQL